MPDYDWREEERQRNEKRAARRAARMAAARAAAHEPVAVAAEPEAEAVDGVVAVVALRVAEPEPDLTHFASALGGWFSECLNCGEDVVLETGPLCIWEHFDTGRAECEPAG